MDWLLTIPPNQCEESNFYYNHSIGDGFLKSLIVTLSITLYKWIFIIRIQRRNSSNIFGQRPGEVIIGQVSLSIVITPQNLQFTRIYFWYQPARLPYTYFRASANTATATGIYYYRAQISLWPPHLILPIPLPPYQPYKHSAAVAELKAICIVRFN